MSAKRPIEMLDHIGLMGSGLRKHLNQPIAGISLLALLVTSVPAPSNAQVPTLPPPPVPKDERVPPPPDPRDKPIPTFTTPITPPEVPPARPTTPPAGTSNLPPETAYTLGSGDRLRVEVFEVPEYTGEFAVLVDGTINMPVIGSVLVRGLTLQQASDRISQLYSRYVRRPVVTVSLLAPRPVKIAIAGEVKRPGTYTVTPGGAGGGAAGAVQTGQFPSITQVITLAGGITQAAAVGQVQIRRRGAPTVYVANLWDLLRNGDIAQDVQLRDGDSLFIPTVDQIDPNDTRTLADASFASRQVEPISVAIVGEVARPGPYEIVGGAVATGGATGAITGATTGVQAGGGAAGGPPTLTKAIQVAGGITAQADVRSVTVRRPTRSGEFRAINVNLWEMLRTGDLSQDVLLQNGDTITIPTATALDPAEATALAGASFAPNTIVVNVVGEVTRPGAIPVPPNTPLNQAILAAGGFNNQRARRGKVELIRLNANGSVTKREINVDLAQGISDNGNPTLRNNDVVVVGRNTVTRIGDTLGTILSPVTNFLGFFNLFRVFGN